MTVNGQSVERFSGRSHTLGAPYRSQRGHASVRCDVSLETRLRSRWPEGDVVFRPLPEHPGARRLRLRDDRTRSNDPADGRPQSDGLDLIRAVEHDKVGRLAGIDRPIPPGAAEWVAGDHLV